MTSATRLPAAERRERDDREALERPRGLAEELDFDTVGRRRVLIEREDDHIARGHDDRL